MKQPWVYNEVLDMAEGEYINYVTVGFPTETIALPKEVYHRNNHVTYYVRPLRVACMCAFKY